MVFITRRTGASEPVSIDPGYEKLKEPPSYRQVLYSDWTPTNLAPHEEEVEVYSNAESVELLLNRKSLGTQLHPADDSPRIWKVPFEPGILRAVAKNKDQVVATYELRTAGKPAKILLTTDRIKLSPTWDDVTYVRASVVDVDGVTVPTAENEISFKVTGPGILAAVDNADCSSHESFQANHCRAYQGQCVAILKATARAGKIRLEASALGLAGSSFELEVLGGRDPRRAVVAFGSDRYRGSVAPATPAVWK